MFPEKTLFELFSRMVGRSGARSVVMLYSPNLALPLICRSHSIVNLVPVFCEKSYPECRAQCR